MKNPLKDLQIHGKLMYDALESTLFPITLSSSCSCLLSVHKIQFTELLFSIK